MLLLLAQVEFEKKQKKKKFTPDLEKVCVAAATLSCC